MNKLEAHNISKWKEFIYTRKVRWGCKTETETKQTTTKKTKNKKQANKQTNKEQTNKQKERSKSANTIERPHWNII
jgi:hypothetical protein